MRLSSATHRLSLKARLMLSYLVVLGAGGLVTSFVGSWIVSTTIMMQAKRAVDHDFATAKTVYEQQLQALRLSVQVAASGTTIQRYLETGDEVALYAYLQGIHRDAGFDFLSLTDAGGRVVLRVSRPGDRGGDASAIAEVKAALAGKVAAATEVLSAAQLGDENPGLPARARIKTGKGEVNEGMALIAAAPLGGAGKVVGVLYGGLLLNGNSAIVDRVWTLLFRGDRFRDTDSGSVTIFRNGYRIATNVRTVAGDRAVGTEASAEVRQAVLERGKLWRGRAFVVKQWYISEYDPVRNYAGEAIGMLSVGILESTYTSIRNSVILSFFLLATIGFLMIIGITYYMIRNITRPLGEMVFATRNISAGRFDQEVQTDSPGEIALLADSFNAMLKSLRQMKGDLEEWGRTLEEKVKQRTEELGAMQVRLAQSERLASLGMLAAGVAHEINNPLGGILALTALTVEDMKKEDPNRETLEEVIRQTERCRDIVKGLLEFSRQSKANTERIDLNKILLDTLSLLAKQALFFNIEIVRDLEPNLPAVMADKSQFQQVFMNIFVNAVQAMDERGTITIASRHDRAGKWVEVAISDTGHGIRPEQDSRCST